MNINTKLASLSQKHQHAGLSRHTATLRSTRTREGSTHRRDTTTNNKQCNTLALSYPRLFLHYLITSDMKHEPVLHSEVNRPRLAMHRFQYHHCRRKKGPKTLHTKPMSKKKKTSVCVSINNQPNKKKPASAICDRVHTHTVFQVEIVLAAQTQCNIDKFPSIPHVTHNDVQVTRHCITAQVTL